MLHYRELQQNEVELVWSIARSEIIDNVYYHENGELVLKPEHYNMIGWSPGGPKQYTPILLDCFDRGGWFYGLFDDDQLVGVAVLESEFIGKIKFLGDPII